MPKGSIIQKRTKEITFGQEQKKQLSIQCLAE